MFGCTVSTQQNNNHLATRLNGDVLAEVAEWLLGHEIGALTLCGDRTLNAKLAHHVRSLKIHSEARNFCWPFYIRGWSALKHLYIHPGKSLDLLKMSFVKTLALVRRALDTLPHSIETLHLEDWPLSFESAFDELWKAQQNPSTTTLQSTINSKPPTKKRALMPIAATTSSTLPPNSGILLLLQHFHLPRLQCFSFTPKFNHCVASMYTQNLRQWLACAPSLPLTHLSLSHVISNRILDKPFDVVLKSLPRTLVHLDLHIDNNSYFNNRNCFETFSTRPSLPSLAEEYDMEMTSVLPPTLTHFSLDLAVATPLPIAFLSGASRLETFKLAVQSIKASSTVCFPRTPNALSYLPASVTRLSFKGLMTADLHTGLSAIPDNHQNLRHLTAKDIQTVGFSVHDSMARELICGITSSPKFWRLESLHIFFKLYLAFLGTRVTGNDNPYADMTSMVHLRSVSPFFLEPEFAFYWKYMAPHLTENSPMTVYSKKNKARPGESVYIAPRWHDMDMWSSGPPHLIANNITLDATSTYETWDSQFAKTLLRSAKYVTIPVVHDLKNLELLNKMPNNSLQSLTLTHSLHLYDIDVRFDWVGVGAVRMLRTLEINVPVSITHLDRWMQALPKTLETLQITSLNEFVVTSITTSTEKVVAAPSAENTLTFIPSNLCTMSVCGNFAIHSSVFDTMPKSLHSVAWKRMIGIVGCKHTSDLCRWPKRVRRVCVETTKTARMPPDFVHSRQDLATWCAKASHLEFASFRYYTNDGKPFKLERKYGSQ